MAKIKRGGITYGRSHKNGGIPVKNQSTGEMLEVEGGEGIVNKRSMASDKMVTFNGQKMTICEAVSALNQMEGGVEFSCDDVEHKQFIEEMELGGELERGKRTEKEHIETLRKLYDKRITPIQATEEVAKEHLKEDPQYYSKLAKMESKMKKGGRASDNPFESMGLKKDFAGGWEDKIDYFLKKSDNFCDVEKKYCASTIDIDRADMPQIYEEYIPQYMDFLEEQGIDSRYQQGVQVGELRPTQKNISLPRMKRMLQRILNGYYTDSEGKMLNPLKRVVIATKDGYLLDGHHRWASSLFLSPKNTVDVLRVEANIKDLVPISKNFGMVEFQKFMFGGKINADETLPRVSSVSEPQQDPKAQKSFTAKRGGFPVKGVTIMPLYEGYVQSPTSGFENIGYTNNGITFTIGNSNLTENTAYWAGKKFEKALSELYPSLVFETSYQGYGGNTYEVVPVDMTDINNRIRRKVLNGQKEGIMVYSRKYGKTIEISVIPFPDSKSLLEDDAFLENVIDALNSTTKFPTANLPSKKQKDTAVITAPAPTPRFYEPNRKYRLKTEKELEFEFGTDWRNRFENLYNRRGRVSSKLFIGTKKCDYLLGKSITLNKEKWRSFWENNSNFRIGELGLPQEGKIQEGDALAFTPFAITFDGYVEDPTEYNSKTRYRFLTQQECQDAGLDPNEIINSFGIYEDNGKSLNDKLLPEMIFGREIPVYIFEWFKYLADIGLKPKERLFQGAFGADSWDIKQVFNSNVSLQPNLSLLSPQLILQNIVDENAGEVKDFFEYHNEKIEVPQALKNYINARAEVIAQQQFSRTAKEILTSSYNYNYFFEISQSNDGRRVEIGEILGINDGANVSYGAAVRNLFPEARRDAKFSYDANSPYIKSFTYEEESLTIEPKIFTKQNIIFTDQSNNSYRGAISDEQIIREANNRYFANQSPLSESQQDLFFGSNIPSPIFEFYRYMTLISNKEANITTLGKDLSFSNTAIEYIAFAPSIGNMRNITNATYIYPSLSLFDVMVGAGQDGEDLYKWNLDATIYKNDPLNKTYAAKEIYNLCAFTSNGNYQWSTNNSVDLELWNIGIDNIVDYFRLQSGFEYSATQLSGVFYENIWVEKNASTKPYSFKRSTNDLDLQIEAIQTLMDSFTEDEIQVKSYLISEIAKLRQQREKQVLSRYYSGNLKELLRLYASKISLAQRTANPNNGCGLATPSGAPSELDLIEYKLVRTAEFKNWFGDWEFAYQTKNYNGVSKAINPRTGEPLVFYHGKGNMQVEATKFGFGVFPIKYFGANFSYAEWFSRIYNDIRTIYEFFVQVKNPIDFSAIGIEDITGDMFKVLVEQLYGYTIKTPVLPQDNPVRVWQILRANPKVLAEIRDNTAYDGFIFYEDNPQDILPNGERNQTLAYGTFKNEQSKAADGRNTTFFAEAEDFRFNKGGVTKKC
jgi:hypothetical protein